MRFKLAPVVIRSPAGRWALFALAVLWAAAGWWIVVDGGLTLSSSRRSLNPVPIDGGPALFMAAIFLGLSTATAAAVLQSLHAGKSWYKLLFLINGGLPLAYWLLR